MLLPLAVQIEFLSFQCGIQTFYWTLNAWGIWVRALVDLSAGSDVAVRAVPLVPRHRKIEQPFDFSVSGEAPSCMLLAS